MSDEFKETETKYRVVSSAEEGLLIVQDNSEQGVVFQVLADHVKNQADLSEFERFRASKLLALACREPNAPVTPIEDLTLEPIFSFRESGGGDLEMSCSLEMFMTQDSGAEFRLGINSDPETPSQFGSAHIRLSKEEIKGFLSFFNMT